MNDFDFIAKSTVAEKYLMQRISEPTVRIVSNERKNDKVLIRRSGRAFCAICRQYVELLSFPGAAILRSTNRGDIDLRTQQGELHRLHNRSGELMICSRSLREYFLGDQQLPSDIAARN